MLNRNGRVNGMGRWIGWMGGLGAAAALFVALPASAQGGRGQAEEATGGCHGGDKRGGDNFEAKRAQMREHLVQALDAAGATEAQKAAALQIADETAAEFEALREQKRAMKQQRRAARADKAAKGERPSREEFQAMREEMKTKVDRRLDQIASVLDDQQKEVFFAEIEAHRDQWKQEHKGKRGGRGHRGAE